MRRHARMLVGTLLMAPGVALAGAVLAAGTDSGPVVVTSPRAAGLAIPTAGAVPGQRVPGPARIAGPAGVGSSAAPTVGTSALGSPGVPGEQVPARRLGLPLAVAGVLVLGIGGLVVRVALSRS